MVLYYLRDLQKAGAIEVIRSPGKGSRYKILLEVNDRIGEWTSVAPVQPIAPLPVQPIAPLPVQPIAPVVDLRPYSNEASTASSAVTDVPAAAAEKDLKGKEMTSISKNTFDELVKLGLPSSAEAQSKVALQPDFAKDVLRHCKRRFGKGRKPVDNPGGYISALLRSPEKFGWVKVDGVWQDPEKPSGPTQEEVAARIEFNKAATRKLLSEAQAAADKAYADMRYVWESVPEEAKQEIREFVMKNSPLLHASGANTAEFELQCMRETMTFARRSWRKKHLVQTKANSAG
jgi:hypothetical protein